jgi:hypothetical protein
VERVGAEVQSASCGRFQTLAGVFSAQAHQTETGTIAHFRMWLGGQDLAEQLCGVGPGGIGPAQQTGGRPLQILLVRFGAMLCNGAGLIGHEAAGVTGHAQTAVENLHRGGGDADVHLPAGQLVGDAVEVPLSRDMIIQFDLQLAPLANLAAFCR